MYDLAYGMQIAQMRAGATGRPALRGLGNTDMLTDAAQATVNTAREVAREAQATGRPGGGNSIMVDPKVDLLDPKGGVTPDSYMGTQTTLPPGDTVGTQLAPVPDVTVLDRFNNLSTPAKVGVVGGGVVAVAGLIWLLKG